MRPGSIIVDISIDQGGNCALTEAGKTIEHQGVLIDGTQNIPGTVPVSATMLFAKNILNFAMHVLQEGGSLNLEDEITAETLVTHQGEILHTGALTAMGITQEGSA